MENRKGSQTRRAWRKTAHVLFYVWKSLSCMGRLLLSSLGPRWGNCPESDGILVGTPLLAQCTAPPATRFCVSCGSVHPALRRLSLGQSRSNRHLFALASRIEWTANLLCRGEVGSRKSLSSAQCRRTTCEHCDRRSFCIQR